MKKSKLSVGLVTSFIGALALSACNATQTVTAKKDTIVDFVGYNQSTDRIEVKTGLYDELGKTDEGTKLYYDAVLETLIRSQYEQLSKDNPDLKKYALLVSEANSKVSSARQTAYDATNSSGKTFDEEWQSVLDSHNCENDEELKQYYLFDLEKAELTDWYSKKNQSSLKKQYIGVNADWSPVAASEQVENVDPVFPYHILHILVTLSADKANYNRGTITSAEATNLWDVVRKLIDQSYDFQQIAMNKSDDTGSKDKYGDVEIMSTKTSFYNEFKLGVYAYDAILSGVNTFKATADGTSKSNAEVYKAMGLKTQDKTEAWVDTKVVTQTTSTETKESVSSLIQKEMVTNVHTPISEEGFTSIPTIPYDVFRKIGAVANDTKVGDDAANNKTGTMAPEGGDIFLPRNILFNQFLNFHSPFVVTNEDVIYDEATDEISVVPHNFETGDLKISDTNFNATVAGKKVLTDKDNNVIIGVRSEAGIHFMVMRKSVFEGTNVAAGREETSLEDYYTTAIPGEDEYPEGKQTFVNMATTTDKSYYTKRVETIKNEITSTSTFDAAFEYRLYEYLMDVVGDKIKFFDEEEGKSEIQTNIENYIKLLRETKHNSDVDSISNAWQTYLNMLRDQNFKRNYKDALISTTCAFKFNKKENEEMFKKGGACYVEK